MRAIFVSQIRGQGGERELAGLRLVDFCRFSPSILNLAREPRDIQG